MGPWGRGEQVKHYFADELEKEVEMTGAQFIVNFLEQKGVTQVYGIPGTAILPFYEATLEREHMRSISVRHEQSAIFMADGYARSTGKVGICAVTSGAGATNLLTGLYNAYGDSVPLIAFTGQVPTNLIGRDAFQEAPIVEMARPVTKAAYLVKKTTDLPKVLSEAWKLATQGRKGPILIDIPVNVQKGLLKINLEDYMRKEEAMRDNIVHVTENQLEQVVTMIGKAEKPVLLVGEEVALANATEDLINLAQFLQIPVVSSFMGKDCFPNYHHLYAGMVGMMCQTPLGNKTILESDLIVNLGGRFDSWSTEEMNLFEDGRKVIHINFDEEHYRQVPTEWTIPADVKTFILKLNQFLLNRYYIPKAEAFKRIESLQIERTRLAQPTDLDSSSFKPKQAIGEVRKGLRPDAIVTLDCGLSQIWANQLNEAYEPRTFLITGRTATRGWGLGAAMGAQLAYPLRQVVNILGEASLGMSLQELDTAAKHNIPVVVVVFHRGLDSVALAKGMGIEAELVERPEQISDALTRAFSTYRPYLIEILVDTDEQRSVSREGSISRVREVS